MVLLILVLVILIIGDIVVSDASNGGTIGIYRVGDMVVVTIDYFPFSQVVFMQFFSPTCPPSSSTGKPLLSHQYVSEQVTL